MRKFGKAIVYVIAVSVISLCFAGCKNSHEHPGLDADHPKAEAPKAEAIKAEAPKAEHPKAEHPE